MWIDDQIIARADEDLVLEVFVPLENVVVLGSSNDPSREVYPVSYGEVPVLRRYGGGGTVLLHDGCVVISIGAWVRHYYKNDHYFRLINDAVIRTLSARWPALSELSQNGISDIVYGERKVAGTSLFRSKNYLLYQASLLVDAKIPDLERYLNHPSKEPEYRGNRSHRDFLTDLSCIVPGLTPEITMGELVQSLPSYLTNHLHEELIPSDSSHIAQVKKRL